MGKIEYAFITLPDDDLFPIAQETFASIFDLAINSYGVAPETLVGALFTSGIVKQFEKLNPVFVSGKSAMELLEIMKLDLGIEKLDERCMVNTGSVEYWVGWIASYYQQETGTPYKRIFEAAPYDVIAMSYHPLHEAGESKFVEVFQERICKTGNTSRLATMRKAMQLSQAELSALSGVSLRSVQMYEQRNKNINHASVETVYRLARILHCEITDLMEL